MINIDKILFKALLLHGNETNLLNDITYQNFKTLFIELAKIRYNIRYCDNENCSCHPESTIKKLLKDDELCDFLQVNHLLESVKCLIGDYKPIIAKGIYEDDK
jgi:hypothetical protein